MCLKFFNFIIFNVFSFISPTRLGKIMRNIPYLLKVSKDYFKSGFHFRVIGSTIGFNERKRYKPFVVQTEGGFL